MFGLFRLKAFIKSSLSYPRRVASPSDRTGRKDRRRQGVNQHRVCRHAAAAFSRVARRAHGPKHRHEAAFYSTSIYATESVFRRDGQQRSFFTKAVCLACSLCNGNRAQSPLRSNRVSLMLRCAQATASVSHPEAHTRNTLSGSLFHFPTLQHCHETTLLFLLSFFFCFLLLLFSPLI